MPVRSRWSAPPITIFYAADQSLAIAVPKASGATEKVYAPQEWPRAMQALRRRKGGARPAKLVLDDAHYLVRTTTMPAAAQNRAGEILALELERLTPFKRTDVCFGWKASGQDANGNIVIEQAVVKRAILAPLIGDLFSAGFDQVGVACRLPDGAAIELRLPPELARNNSGALKTARLIDRLTWAAIVVGAYVAIWLLFARQADAVARLDYAIASAQAQAIGVRSSYDSGLASARGVLNLRDRKTTVPSVTALIEELTHLLPDDSWLTELRIDGADVEIVGYARSAAGLTLTLDRSDLFGEVKLVSPVVRSPADNVERFDISMRTTAPAEPVAAAGTQ